jgi:hypothetical protein
MSTASLILAAVKLLHHPAQHQPHPSPHFFYRVYLTIGAEVAVLFVGPALDPLLGVPASRLDG